jgi:hypothetical protein
VQEVKETLEHHDEWYLILEDAGDDQKGVLEAAIWMLCAANVPNGELHGDWK